MTGRVAIKIFPIYDTGWEASEVMISAGLGHNLDCFVEISFAKQTVHRTFIFNGHMMKRLGLLYLPFLQIIFKYFFFFVCIQYSYQYLFKKSYAFLVSKFQNI